MNAFRLKIKEKTANDWMGLEKSLFHDDLYDCIARKGIIKLHPIDNRQGFPFILRPAEFPEGLA